MLSGKVKRERRKNNNGSNSKKAAKKCTLFCTFLCRCFAEIQRETSINFLVKRFMKKCRTCFCFFFSLPLIFTVVAASISHFLTAATKFSCCSSTQKYLNCILSLTLALCRSFTRWASLACHLLSLFLCISISLYSKFVDMKTNLSLIL